MMCSYDIITSQRLSGKALRNSALSPAPPSRAKQALTGGHLARAAAELVRQGVRVEHRRTMFLPVDDTCFYLFEAPSAEAVRMFCERAGLGHVRIVEAVET